MKRNQDFVRGTTGNHNGQRATIQEHFEEQPQTVREDSHWVLMELFPGLTVPRGSDWLLTNTENRVSDIPKP